MAISPIRVIQGAKVYVSKIGGEANEKLLSVLEHRGLLHSYSNVKIRNGIASLEEKFLENFGTTSTTRYLNLSSTGGLQDLASKSRYTNMRNGAPSDGRGLRSLWSADHVTGNARSRSVTTINGTITKKCLQKMYNHHSSDNFYYLGGNDYSNLVKDYRYGVYSRTIADPTGQRGVAIEFGRIKNVDGKEVLERTMGGSLNPNLGKLGQFDETLARFRAYPNTVGYQFVNGMTGYQGRTINEFSARIKG